ncbi:MAG TPA: hypothetical protein VF515_21155 [Candidatus Binatia bacterium]|jgi:hypothetical protein
MSHRAAEVAPPAGESPPGRAAGTYRRIWDLAWPVGMFISIVFEAVVMFAWYRRGTWKTKKL